ncbi:MAG: hypothetical protein ACRDT8_14605 [Micromonosporaceae bacterium]
MILAELVEAAEAAVALAQHGATVIIDPLAATPKPKGIDTKGVVEFLLSKIAPIFLAVLGLIFIGRAGKGEVSKVVTSSAIAIVGLAFIGGALVLVFLGGYLVKLFFT